MNCQYCGKRLSFTRRLKGHTFCSLEHQELHYGGGTAAFERLRDSFDNTPAKKPDPKHAREGTIFEPAKWQTQTGPPAAPQQIEVVETVERGSASLEIAALGNAISDTSESDSLAVEASEQVHEVTEASSVRELAALIEGVGNNEGSAPQFTEAAAQEDEDAAPALVVSGPMDSAETAIESEPPEAWFLRDLRAVQDRRSLSLKSPVAEPISTVIEGPTTTARDLLSRGSWPVVVDISAKSTVDAGTLGANPTWGDVPPGYPPVIVSGSATLVLDSKAAGFVPLPPGECCPGTGPARLFANDAIEPPAREPELPLTQLDQRSAPDLPALLERPFAASELRQPRQWFGTILPVPMDALIPECPVVRRFAVARQEYGGVPPASAFAVVASPAAMGWNAVVTPGAHLPAATMLRRPQNSEEMGSISGSLGLANTNSRGTTDLVGAIAGGSASIVETYPWVEFEVDGWRPQTSTVRPQIPQGLPADTNTITVGHSIATFTPPTIDTAAAEVTVAPCLHSTQLSIGAPSLPQSSEPLPLQGGARPLPVAVDESQYAKAITHLQPSLPSPWSLITWAPSLAISIPAAERSILGTAAQVEAIANQGTVEGLRPWSPGQRCYRLMPSLPQPGVIASMPEAPAQAPVQLLAMKSLAPGSEGTSPPDLASVRVQPVSMSVLALKAFPGPRVLEIVPPLSGLSLEDGIQLTGAFQNHLGIFSDLHAECPAVLPAFVPNQAAHAPRPVPSNDRIWGEPIPPDKALDPIKPFSAVHRVPESMSASLATG